MAETINHPMDHVLKQALLEYGVSDAGAFQFMQEQNVTDVNDRHALRVLLWRFTVGRRADNVLPPYEYSKVKNRGRGR